jgi:hypothetical protein
MDTDLRMNFKDIVLAYLRKVSRHFFEGLNKTQKFCKNNRSRGLRITKKCLIIGMQQFVLSGEREAKVWRLAT